MRGEAIKAGERATSDHEFRELRDKSRAYKSLKQRKTREYRRAAVARIEQAYHCDRGNMCKIISQTVNSKVRQNIPSPDQFFNHFRTLTAGCTVEYFDYDYEK